MLLNLAFFQEVATMSRKDLLVLQALLYEDKKKCTNCGRMCCDQWRSRLMEGPCSGRLCDLSIVIVILSMHLMHFHVEHSKG